jgi:hypothetical protein
MSQHCVIEVVTARANNSPLLIKLIASTINSSSPLSHLLPAKLLLQPRALLFYSCSATSSTLTAPHIPPIGTAVILLLLVLLPVENLYLLIAGGAAREHRRDSWSTRVGITRESGVLRGSRAGMRRVTGFPASFIREIDVGYLVWRVGTITFIMKILEFLCFLALGGKSS